MGFPLLQKSTEMCVGRQIQVLGSYWTGHMSNEEENSLYKHTVREYHALYKWDAGGTFKCNIEDETGKVCGAERSLLHSKDKTVSSTNLIQHIEKTSKRCASHASVDAVLKNSSPNYVTKMLALSCCHVRVWGLTRKSNSYREKLV